MMAMPYALGVSLSLPMWFGLLYLIHWLAFG